MSSKHKYRVAVTSALEELSCIPDELRRPRLGKIEVEGKGSERSFRYRNDLCEVEGTVSRTGSGRGFVVCVMMTLDQLRTPAREYPHTWHHTWIR